MQTRPRRNRSHRFKCAMEGCHKAYIANKHLNEHVRVYHPQNGLFLCSWCDSHFQGADAYSSHIERAHKQCQLDMSLSAPNHLTDSSALQSRSDQRSTAADYRIPPEHLSVFQIEHTSARADGGEFISGGPSVFPFRIKDIRITGQSGVPAEYLSVFPIEQVNSRGRESAGGLGSSADLHHTPVTDVARTPSADQVQGVSHRRQPVTNTVSDDLTLALANPVDGTKSAEGTPGIGPSVNSPSQDPSTPPWEFADLVDF
jgi:hypothetical protein